MTDSLAADTSPPRPPLAFRVGVTGARNLHALPPAAQDAIRRQVRAVLDAVRGVVARIADSGEARAFYAAPGGAVSPCLRVVSPLAEGADRLVAEEASALGYELDVAFPFARGDYAGDFTAAGSRDAFDGWLDGPLARPVLELDGRRDGAEGGTPGDTTLSYEAVGRFVVRNCDLLIAIWDGEPAKGRGGTAEIARFCARSGRPVWWIDAKGVAAPRLVTATTRLRWQEASISGEAASADLADLIKSMLRPPGRRTEDHEAHLHGSGSGAASDGNHEHAGLIARTLRRLHGLGERMPAPLRRRLHRWFGPGDGPLLDYLQERPKSDIPPWRLYGWLYRRLAGPSSVAYRPVAIPKGPAAYWKAFYEPADRASSAYGNRYRSSYVWVFLLATAAVICAILSLGYTILKPWATPIELAILVAIFGLVAVNIQRRWHRRWIAYRLLAELCRKQAALAVLGWSLPPPDLRRFDAPNAPEAWVGWYFNAAVRAAPLPTGSFRGARLEETRRYVLEALVADQEEYHQDRNRRSRDAGRRLVGAGEFFFFLTLAFVAVKLLLIALAEPHDACAPFGHGPDYWHGAIVFLGVCAAILPALSAASVGVRAYAELELLESQSKRMAGVMTEARTRIADMDLSRPLASQDLAAEVYDIAAEMLRDVTGWAELFRVKAVEAG